MYRCVETNAQRAYVRVPSFFSASCDVHLLARARERCVRRSCTFMHAHAYIYTKNQHTCEQQAEEGGHDVPGSSAAVTRGSLEKSRTSCKLYTCHVCMLV